MPTMNEAPRGHAKLCTWLCQKVAGMRDWLPQEVGWEQLPIIGQLLPRKHRGFPKEGSIGMHDVDAT
jgi:hypothetical protein